MTDRPAGLMVEGALRVDGPGGPFHVTGEGDRIAVRAPGLLDAWRLARAPALDRISGLFAATDLPVRVTVRGHTVAQGRPGGAPGIRVRWRGVLRAGAAAATPDRGSGSGDG